MPKNNDKFQSQSKHIPKQQEENMLPAPVQTQS